MAISFSNIKAGFLLVAVACACWSMYELGRQSSRPDFPTPAEWAAQLSPEKDGRAPPAPGLMDHDEFMTRFAEASQGSVHVSLDKAVYKPGQTVFARGLLLSSQTRALLPVSQCQVEVVDSKGASVFSSGCDLQDGAAASWTIPRSGPGGEYTLKMSLRHARASNGMHLGVRKFQIRAGSTPRLRLQLDFAREGYGPGDLVEATLHAFRPSGQPAKGARVTASARLDGVQVFSGEPSPVDPEGKTSVSFVLPQQIESGEGQLSLRVDDAGVLETTSKTLPVLMQALDASVYPEGGDLVSGLPNRVYVEAFTPWGNPADFDGEIRAVGSSSAVATVRTVHEGRGVSSYFVPSADHEYHIVVSSPASVTKPIPLPRVARAGATLSVPEGVVEGGDHVLLRVSAAPGVALRVTLSRQITELSSMRVVIPSDGTATVTLTPPATPAGEGVLRATVFDAASGRPLAERLLFRRPSSRVSVNVVTDKPSYKAGDTVQLRVETRTFTGKPVSALVGLAVTDESVLQSLPARRFPPRLPVMALLEAEVASLADPEAYSVLPPIESSAGSSSEPQSSVPIDLLLGTQGWRRFAFSYPQKFLTNLADDADLSPKSDEKETFPFWDFGALKRNDKALSKREAALRMMCLPEHFNENVRVYGGADLAFMKGGEAFGAGRGAPGRPMMMNAMPVAARMAPMPQAAMEMEMNMDVDMVGGPPVVQAGAAPGAPAGAFYAPELELRVGMAEMDEAVPIVDFPVGAEGVAGDVRVEAGHAEVAGAMLAPEADFAPMEDVPIDAPLPPMGEGMAFPEPLEDMADGDFGEDEIDPAAKFARPVAPPQPHFAAKRMAPRHRTRYPVMVRQFAFKKRPAKKGEEAIRNEFAETVYWNAGQWTDDRGVFEASFQLGDSITAFRAAADVLTRSGVIGSGDGWVSTQAPIEAEVKVPMEVTVGDKVHIPVTTIIAAQEHKSDQTVVDLTAQGSNGVQADLKETWKQSSRGHLTYVPAQFNKPSGQGELEAPSLTVSVVDQGTKEKDVVVKSIPVVPGGFPVNVDRSGMLSAAATDPVQHTFDVSSDALAASWNASIIVYPSPVSRLDQALASLIRQPCGCFEQTSATTYPLIMALSYFKTHANVDPTLIERAEQMLADGYKKLISFESDGGGFEWFGGSPAHESLTAYGVLQFQDMAEVFDVDKDLLQRTRSWLKNRADGDGSFLRNPRSLDSFGSAPSEITDVYIVWSLVMAGDTGLDREVEALLKIQANDDSKFRQDPYFIGMLAGILYKLGRHEAASSLSARLAKIQADDGSVPGASTSITCSGGMSLTIEATSAAALAWLQDETYMPNAQKAVDWIVSQCQNGRFGSTQATVLALKAIIAYDVAMSKPRGSGTVSLKFEGDVVSSAEFTPETEKPLHLDARRLLAKIRPGEKVTVQLALTSTQPDASMPYSLHLQYHTSLPPSDEDCAVRLRSSLSPSTLLEGGVGEVSVRITNTQERDLPMVIALVGMPAGVEPRHEHLRELVQAGKIAFYELQGRDIALYWRGMAASSVLDLSIQVEGRVPGSYTGAASRAYLYYTEELKSWAPGLSAEVLKRTDV